MRPRLNYHHLSYFRTVVREGGVSEASRKLRLTQPTISTQIHQLEMELGAKLFERHGRRLALTEEGNLALRYAEEIFSLGEELVAVLEGAASARKPVLRVGLVDIFPKYVAVRICEPILTGTSPPRLVVEEASLEELLIRLASNQLDILIADRPVPAGSRVRAFSHRLGDCGISFIASRKLAAKLRKRFPRSLNDAPLLLPGAGSELRRSIDRWLEHRMVALEVAGEIQDNALLKLLAESGVGIAPVPTVVEAQVCRGLQLTVVGRAEDVREHFYLISAERRVTNPYVITMTAVARKQLFG